MTFCLSYFITTLNHNLKLLFLFFRMFPATNNVKHAGRYFEQFVKVAHKSGGSSSKDTSVVKNLPASLYTSPKSKYNSTSTNGQYGQSNGKKNWILIPLLKSLSQCERFSQNFCTFSLCEKEIINNIFWKTRSWRSD